MRAAYGPLARAEGRATLRAMRLAFATALALLSAGCSPDGGHHAEPPSYRVPTPCSSATSCDTCTPILGCGWCQYADGRGTCTSGPSLCKGDSFRWNWEPTSCPVVDAGADAPPVDATPADAGADAAIETATDAATEAATETGGDAGGDAADETATDAADPDAPADGATDAATDAATDGDPDTGAADTATTDAGACGIAAPPSGCAITTGGTLCKAGQYTVGCLGSAAPAGCAAALVKPGESYWCCACK